LSSELRERLWRSIERESAPGSIWGKSSSSLPASACARAASSSRRWLSLSYSSTSAKRWRVGMPFASVIGGLPAVSFHVARYPIPKFVRACIGSFSIDAVVSSSKPAASEGWRSASERLGSCGARKCVRSLPSRRSSSSNRCEIMLYVMRFADDMKGSGGGRRGRPAAADRHRAPPGREGGESRPATARGPQRHGVLKVNLDITHRQHAGSILRQN
jgi:hypothetical protein